MFTAIILVFLGAIVAGLVFPVIIALMRPDETPKKTLVKGRGGFYRYKGHNYTSTTQEHD